MSKLLGSITVGARRAFSATRRGLHTFREWKPTPSTVFLGLLITKVLYILVTLRLLCGEVYSIGVPYNVGFNPVKELIACAIFLPLTFLFTRLKFRSQFASNVLYFLYIVYFIPINSAFSLNNTDYRFLMLSTLHFVLFVAAVFGLDRLFVGRTFKKKAPSPLCDKPAFNDFYIRLFCAAVCILFVVHKLMYNGLDFSLNISADTVYTNRETYNQYMRSIAGTPFSYALAIVTNLASMVMPFYVLISLIRKRPLGVLLGVLCALSMYAVSYQKSKLLFLLITFVVYFLYRLTLLENFKKLLTVGIIACLLLCFVEWALRSQSSLYTVLIRREMYIPSWMNTIYYDYFSEHAKVLWTQDVFLFKNFLPNGAYAVSPLEIINHTYFAGDVPSPNTGMFAEAYMHFGTVGVFAYPALLSVIVMLSHLVYKPFGEAVGILTVCQLGMSFLNVPITWTYCVLSYFLFTFIVWLVPKVPLPRPKAPVFDWL